LGESNNPYDKVTVFDWGDPSLIAKAINLPALGDDNTDGLISDAENLAHQVWVNLNESRDLTSPDYFKEISFTSDNSNWSNGDVRSLVDNDSNTSFSFFNQDDGKLPNVVLSLKAAKVVSRIGLTSGSSALGTEFPARMNVFGSLDGTTYQLLGTVELSPPKAKSTDYPDITFSNTNAYAYYKLELSLEPSKNLVELSEIRLFESTAQGCKSSVRSSRRKNRPWMLQVWMGLSGVLPQPPRGKICCSPRVQCFQA